MTMDEWPSFSIDRGVFVMSEVQVNPQAQVSEKSSTPKLGWTIDELARSLSVSVPFIRLEVKRGRLKAAHLGRRVVVLDTEVRRYLAQASESSHSWR
jgi:excisionase family DNA binding protein